MSRLKLIIVLLVTVAAIQLVALLGLTLVFYQVTPNSVLAQNTFIGRIQPVLLFVRLADRSLNFFYRGPSAPEQVPFYEIDIATKDLALLEEEISKIEVFLEDDAKLWLPAILRADGETFNVEMRVRGDRFNHWKFRKKSWRVKFPKDHLFRGMRQITLIIPEDRGWFAEPLNSYRAKKLGLLQPPMRIVGVSINSSKPLAYLEVEHWTKEMLEKLGRPGDVNFFNQGGVQTSVFDGWDPLFEALGYSDKYVKSSVSPHNSYEELELLFSLHDQEAHLQENFKERINTLFDIEQIIRWHAQSLLSGNLHAGANNMRIFFNYTTGRFEPIPWDVFLVSPRSLLTEYPSKLWQQIFAVPEWNVALHRFLWEYVSSDEQIQDDLQQSDHLRAMIERLAYRDPLKLPSNRQVKYDLDKRTNEIRANLESIYEQLQMSEVLVTQRLPSGAEQAKGVDLILDVIVRGPVAATFSGVLLPLSVLKEGEIVFARDDGNGIFSAEDAVVSYERVQSKTHDVIVFDEKYMLMSPGQPEVNDIGEPLEAPHTRYRFFVRGLNEVGANNLPLLLDLRNAVTNASAQVIRTTVVDDSLYQDSVPELP